MPTLGGPIKKDKLWVFGTTRYFSVNNFIANTSRDDGSQGLDDQFILDGLMRVTWQATPRNKFSGYFDEVQMAVSQGESSTVALKGSTEEEQFDEETPLVHYPN